VEIRYSCVSLYHNLSVKRPRLQVCVHTSFGLGYDKAGQTEALPLFVECCWPPLWLTFSFVILAEGNLGAQRPAKERKCGSKGDIQQ
jgi:hypothetical protein